MSGPKLLGAVELSVELNLGRTIVPLPRCTIRVVVKLGTVLGIGNLFFNHGYDASMPQIAHWIGFRAPSTAFHPTMKWYLNQNGCRPPSIIRNPGPFIITQIVLVGAERLE